MGVDRGGVAVNEQSGETQEDAITARTNWAVALALGVPKRPCIKGSPRAWDCPAKAGGTAVPTGRDTGAEEEEEMLAKGSMALPVRAPRFPAPWMERRPVWGTAMAAGGGFRKGLCADC